MTSTTTALPVEFVAEMAPLPGNEGEKPIAEPSAPVSCAREVLVSQIADVQASLAASVTPEKLAEISRYAKDKEIPQLPASWVASVQLHPLHFEEAAAGDGDGVVVFGNKTKEGFNLPSHVPGIVFRKLVIRVYVSSAHKRISKIVVSIRGWCEE